MNETKKKWIDKEWSKLIVGGIISLVVGFILIIITIIITPLPVGNILNGYLISLQRLINRIIFYKFAVWELILAAFSYYCFVLAKRQNKINKEVPVKEIMKVPTVLDEPSVQPIKPKVQLATQPTRPVSKGDYIPDYKISNKKKMLADVAMIHDGITYQWEWVLNPLVKVYEVKEFFAVCSNQNCHLVHLYKNKAIGVSLTIQYLCPLCDQEYYTTDSPHKIKQIIQKQYPQLVGGGKSPNN